MFSYTPVTMDKENLNRQDLVYLGNTNHYDPGTPGGEPNAEYPFMNKK